MRSILFVVLLCAACAQTGVEFALSTSPALQGVDGGEGDWAALRVATARITTPRTWDGRLDGRVTLWHDNGVKSGEGAYVDDERDGPWTFWHPNGRLRWQGTFEDGAVVGPERAWHANGQLHYEATSVAGEFDGAYVSWHENGLRASEGTYLDGERDGDFRAWNEDGTPNRAESGLYRRGRKVADR